MLLLFEGYSFTFNGRSSNEYGLFLCRASSSPFSRPFGLNRKVNKIDSGCSPLPYLMNTESSVLENSITLGSRHTLSTAELREIADWLYLEDYAPFTAGDNPDIVYQLLFTDEGELFQFVNGGYITISFMCNAPWAWTKPLMKTYDLRYNTGTYLFTIENLSNDKIYNPLEVELYIPKFGTNGSTYDERLSDYPAMRANGELIDDSPVIAMDTYEITIHNLRNTRPDNALKISSCPDSTPFNAPLIMGETLHIKMQDGQIESDQTSIVSRLENCNLNWVKLERGINTIAVTGRCILTVKCQSPVII